MVTSNKRDEPVVQLVHSSAAAEWATSTERIPVFSVTRPNPEYGQPIAEGAEPEPPVLVDTYTMPAKPNAGLALDYLRRARREGELAMSWLIETAVGEAGYDALVEDLASYEGDALEVLRGIVTKIQQVAMGGLDGGPKA